MSTTTFRETLCIDREHPALPGHFPGQPVVPGVMLLDWVAAALGRWRGLRIAGLAQVALPLTYIRIGVAGALMGLGVYKLIRSRHFRWGGMQVGFRDLTIWSFLMASAHGAGLMVLPVFLAGPHAHHHAAAHGTAGSVWATLIHTLGYFSVTAAVALLVYQKFGLAMLRRSWFNLDLIWAIALVVTGFVALLV